MPRGLRTAIVWATIPLAIACTLVTGLKDLDSKTGAGVDAARAADAALQPDAPPDGPAAADGGDAATRFCATVDAQLCDDFERDAEVKGPWSDAIERDGGLKIDSDGTS